MKISREVKISDDNYGNSTHRLEFEINAMHLTQVSGLLNSWESLLRSGAANFTDTETMTVREARVAEAARAEFDAVVQKIAALVKESAQ